MNAIYLNHQAGVSIHYVIYTYINNLMVFCLLSEWKFVARPWKTCFFRLYRPVNFVSFESVIARFYLTLILKKKTFWIKTWQISKTKKWSVMLPKWNARSGNSRGSPGNHSGSGTGKSASLRTIAHFYANRCRESGIAHTGEKARRHLLSPRRNVSILRDLRYKSIKSGDILYFLTPGDMNMNGRDKSEDLQCAEWKCDRQNAERRFRVSNSKFYTFFAGSSAQLPFK